MRTKRFFAWAALRWLLLMFVVAPALEAPLVAYASAPLKPLKVWTGVASWYGPRFQGRRTANGETYDMNGPTAAHPNLPFGSLVRVVDSHTGQAQLVRINDRGPYVVGRDLDVSYYLAKRLGMRERGLSRVRMELLEVPQRHPAPKQAAN